jgi:hypothetical protein
VFGSIRIVGGRREEDVEGETETVLDHGGNDALEKVAGKLEAGVSVYLDKPWFEISINHEVKTKYLEVVLFMGGRELQISTTNSISCNFLHFWDNLSLEIVTFLWILRI